MICDVHHLKVSAQLIPFILQLGCSLFNCTIPITWVCFVINPLIFRYGKMMCHSVGGETRVCLPHPIGTDKKLQQDCVVCVFN